jgi:hypothetical protein
LVCCLQSDEGGVLFRKIECLRLCFARSLNRHIRLNLARGLDRLLNRCRLWSAMNRQVVYFPLSVQTSASGVAVLLDATARLRFTSGSLCATEVDICELCRKTCISTAGPNVAGIIFVNVICSFLASLGRGAGEAVIRVKDVASIVDSFGVGPSPKCHCE